VSDRIGHVVVAGAGIGGLMSALALSRRGFRATILERDPPPPPDADPADSMRWRRRGVPQAVHPHFFMGRLRLLIEARYPDLMARLFDAGASENAFADYVHPLVRDRYHPQRADDRLRSLNARRTTFEMVVRQYALEQPGVTIRYDSRVIRPLTDAPAQRPVSVRGLVIETDGHEEAITADAVIDASGRFSRLRAQLEAAGVVLDLDQRDSGIWYLTRHYRLNPGCSYPQTAGLPGVRFGDFIVGALPADNGAFTVTFQIYRDDTAIARALRDPDHFQAMCGAIGRIAPWVDPAIATPTSEVLGFAQMDSFWQRTVLNGEPRVLGYFALGDSCVRSNPKYGRGCTWTTVAAHHLADLLATELSAAERITRYEHVLEHEFRADWLTMRRLDRGTERAFEVASGLRRPTLGERASGWFEMLIDRALIIEPDLFREVWTGYHGLAGMSDWLRRPMVWPRLARAWATSRRFPELCGALAIRPSRAQMGSPLAGAQPESSHVGTQNS
jgi:2-polyprenyl-6-methoxyphenol hydroxylase-like FAD-dependent oxidoreductase